MIDWLLLILGFTGLCVGATWLTNGSVAVAKRLRISEYLIGMTIVAVGTSLPELTVSTASTIAGNVDIAIGNIVGSNIFNTLLILGCCSLIRPIGFTRSNLRVDIPTAIAVTLALVAMLWNRELSRIEGAALLIGYVSVLVLSARIGKSEGADEEQSGSEKPFSWWRSIALIVVGLCGLVYGGRLTLDSAVAIAKAYGIAEEVIAITIIAGGTSLPELAASIAALVKGHGALALGNVLGSNIANILLILGTCSVISPLRMVGVEMTDIWVMAASLVAILVMALIIGRHRITRFEAVICLVGYGAYIWYLINR